MSHSTAFHHVFGQEVSILESVVGAVVEAGVSDRPEQHLILDRLRRQLLDRLAAPYEALNQ
jgi:hypothetical protein